MQWTRWNMVCDWITRTTIRTHHKQNESYEIYVGNLSADDCYAESTSIRVNILGSTDASGAMRPMWCRYNNKRLTFVYCFRFGQEECSDSIPIHTLGFPCTRCIRAASRSHAHTPSGPRSCMCACTMAKRLHVWYESSKNRRTHTHARSCVYTHPISTFIRSERSVQRFAALFGGALIGIHDAIRYNNHTAEADVGNRTQMTWTFAVIHWFRHVTIFSGTASMYTVCLALFLLKCSAFIMIATHWLSILIDTVLIRSISFADHSNNNIAVHS